MDKKEIKLLIDLLKVQKAKVISIFTLLIFSALISLVMPLINRRIMDDGLIAQNASVVIKFSLLLFGLSIVNSMLNFFKERTRVSMKGEIIFSLYQKAFKHFEVMKISEFNKKSNTEYYNNIYNDIASISMLSDSFIFLVIAQIFNIIGGLIGLSMISLKLTLCVLLFIPVKILFIKYFSKKIKKLASELIIKNSNFSNWFGDTLNGINELKIYNVFDVKVNEFDEQMKEIIKTDKQLVLEQEMNSMSDRLIMQGLLALIYIIGINMILNLELTVGSILSFSTYAVYVVTPISTILNVNVVLSNVAPSMKRYFEFIESTVEVEEDNIDDGININEINDVEFKNISFGYDEDNTILKDVSFKIEQNEKVAIIGHNGSGKSTVINLLMRYYTAQEGQIFVNDLELDKINISTYREKISLVSQQSYIFNDTIKNNIMMYKKYSEEMFINVLKECKLYEFYKTVPAEFKVGENGKFVSSGQRQKILLARAIIRNNGFIILDEATSNVDIDTEVHINNMLTTTLKDKTVLVVTHKQDILESVDKIIFINDGKIVDVGTHNELLLNSKEYLNFLKKEAQ